MFGLLHSMTRWCQWPLYMSLENLTFLSEEPASLLLHTEAIETHRQFTEVINALRLVKEGKSAVALALPETYESLLQSAKTFTSRIYGCACELYNSVPLYSYKTALSRHRHIVLIALSRTLQSTYKVYSEDVDVEYARRLPEFSHWTTFGDEFVAKDLNLQILIKLHC